MCALARRCIDQDSNRDSTRKTLRKMTGRQGKGLLEEAWRSLFVLVVCGGVLCSSRTTLPARPCRDVRQRRSRANPATQSNGNEVRFECSVVFPRYFFCVFGGACYRKLPRKFPITKTFKCFQSDLMLSKRSIANKARDCYQSIQSAIDKAN